MDRPADVFDRVHEWEALERFAEDDSPGATLGVVSGRRRQGKSYLLEAACEQTDGFYFQATEATATESLRLLGRQLADHIGAPVPLALDGWPAAIDALLRLGERRPTLVVLDEFPYLLKPAPELPSVIQAAFGPRRRQRMTSRTRLVLCGSALAIMGKLLSGSAPLRGRSGMELTVATFDYRLARQFWGIGDPRLAVLTNAVVGGTPAYRREYVRGDTPRSVEDFDAWIVRAVLDPASPLLKEARYLLSEEPDLRDLSLYHSVLAAVAEGNSTRGGIAGYIGRKTTDIAHPLAVLEDAGFLVRQEDLFRERRPTWRIAEPLVSFYHAIMRPRWAQLERPGRARAVWRGAQETFRARIVGPHFEYLCRTWASSFASSETFGSEQVGEVGPGTVNDAPRRRQHEIDVAVLSPADRSRRRLLSLGEAKWGDVMGVGHLERLRGICDLLSATGTFDTRATRLACYSGVGFTPELRAAASRDDVVLVDLERLYAGE